MRFQNECECSILFDGNPLPEYQVAVSEDNDKVIKCYVVAQDGRPFNIAIKNLKNSSTIARIKIDGQNVEGWHLYPFGSLTYDGPSISPTLKKPLLFAKPRLLTDDDEEFNPLRSKLSGTVAASLGSITIEFWAYEYHGQEPKTSFSTPNFTTTFHEREKKCIFISHLIEFGAPVEDRSSSTKMISKGRYLDTIPYATLVFEYRSLQMLQHMNIIPTPASVSNANDDEVIICSVGTKRKSTTSHATSKRLAADTTTASSSSSSFAPKSIFIDLTLEDDDDSSTSQPKTSVKSEREVTVKVENR
ncbi:hypothetical protein HK102_005586 [Quaeritorhiza haematococci]|nr:hypothetical protein HK102_005586 [Quaeritorhiza haematococci]